MIRKPVPDLIRDGNRLLEKDDEPQKTGRWRFGVDLSAVYTDLSLADA
jgi:hypothetical protein